MCPAPLGLAWMARGWVKPQSYRPSKDAVVKSVLRAFIKLPLRFEAAFL